MLKLYFAPGACSLSPHIVLREAGLNFELEQVSLQTRKTKSGADYLAINPKGQVPLLQLDGGDKLTEGPAIVQYIADQAPDSGLVPKAGTVARYHAQEWLNYVTSELHKSFSALFRPNTPEEYIKITKENLAGKFAYLDQHLGSHPYLMGASFMVPDAYCFVVTSWSKYKDIDLGRWPNLKAYVDRVGARPKVQEAMKAEGIIK
jgi:glutathione S-transferase